MCLSLLPPLEPLLESPAKEYHSTAPKPTRFPFSCGRAGCPKRGPERLARDHGWKFESSSPCLKGKIRPGSQLQRWIRPTDFRRGGRCRPSPNRHRSANPSDRRALLRHPLRQCYPAGCRTSLRSRALIAAGSKRRGLLSIPSHISNMSS